MGAYPHLARAVFFRPVCLLLIVAMASLSLPRDAARAAMVSTETVIGGTAQGESDRDRIRTFLQREEIGARLEAYGVEQHEALARVDGLTDREVARIAARLDELPAGGDLENVLKGMGNVLLFGLILLAILGVVWLVKKIVD